MAASGNRDVEPLLPTTTMSVTFFNTSRRFLSGTTKVRVKKVMWPIQAYKVLGAINEENINRSEGGFLKQKEKEPFKCT
jgi:hypothetical protein